MENDSCGKPTCLLELVSLIKNRSSCKRWSGEVIIEARYEIFALGLMVGILGQLSPEG